jgi:hypothetical protein
VRISLTPAGRELTSKAVDVAQAVDREFFGSKPENLRSALRRIAETHHRRTPPR